MKRKKKSPKKIIMDRLDKLWSQCIRKKYPRCIVCGSVQGLSAHHAIVRKAQSMGVRWLLSNGVALCYNDHINKLHGPQGDKEFLDRYMAILNDLIPDDEQQNIRDIGHRVNKFELSDLMDIEQRLKEFLAGE